MTDFPEYKIGDLVVYYKRKHTTRPNGDTAIDIKPEELGEYYSYTIKKYWKVINVNRPNNSLTVITRTGKYIILSYTDDNLRQPNLWERIFQKYKWKNL